MDHEYSSDGGNWCALCGLPESDSNHFDPVDLTALVEELRTMNLIGWRVACAHKFSDPAGLQRIDKLITERLGI